MVALPATGSFLAGSRSNEAAGLLLEEWLAFVKRMYGGAVEQQATIGAGSVTPSSFFVQVDTEGQTASDDLDYINAAGWEPGQIICIRSRDASRTVNVRHARGTNNQVFLVDTANLALTSTSVRLYLLRTSTQWLEIERVYGTQHGAYLAWRGLGNVPLSVFATGELGVLAGNGGSYNHGLGGTPVSLEGYLICKTAEEGFAIGDMIKLDSNNGFDASRHIMIGCNATQVFYRCLADAGFDGNTIFSVNRVSGSPQMLTPSRWRLIVRAWR